MARAETKTKLPLDRWAQIVGINPMHFNGVYVRAPTTCAEPWLQFPYQTADRVSREEVAIAIAHAEAMCERFLRYRLLPTWETDEWHESIRPNLPELHNISVSDLRGYSQTVQAKHGHFLSGGIRASTLIEADTAVAYTDPDGDSYDEVATVTVTVDVGQSGCELRVYFPVSNTMVATGGEDQWEIKPISVSVSGTTATITFRREQAVLPQLQVDLVPPTDDSHLRGVDGADAANFLDEVDVYRVYNDPQTQATFLWEPFECDDAALGSYIAQTGFLMIRDDPRLSRVGYRAGTWDSATSAFVAVEWARQRSPDIVRLWYYAGLRTKNLDCPTVAMDPDWERTVAYFAAALLDRPICECNNVQAWVAHWQRDLAIAGEEEGLSISPADLDSEFGTRRGAVAAWRRVIGEDGAVGHGVSP
jgi:hypothetical protein